MIVFKWKPALIFTHKNWIRRPGFEPGTPNQRFGMLPYTTNVVSFWVCIFKRRTWPHLLFLFLSTNFGVSDNLKLKLNKRFFLPNKIFFPSFNTFNLLHFVISLTKTVCKSLNVFGLNLGKKQRCRCDCLSVNLWVLLIF